MSEHKPKFTVKPQLGQLGLRGEEGIIVCVCTTTMGKETNQSIMLAKKCHSYRNDVLLEDDLSVKLDQSDIVLSDKETGRILIQN